MRTRTFRRLAAALALMLAWPLASLAQVSVRDDLGRTVLIKKPATRVVTLAPFLTEILYAVGAGDKAVGVDALSEWPPEVLSLPKLASGTGFSYDRVTALNPDLVIAWRDGIRKEDVERLSAHGTIVYVAQARQLEDVTRIMQAVGALTGRNSDKAVADFELRLERVKAANRSKAPVTAFVEIWNRPLTTVSGRHFLTEALAICKAKNVFEDLPAIAPKVTVEQVYEKDPWVIIGAGSAANAEEFRGNWNLRSPLAAVGAHRLLFVADETVSQLTPRSPEAIARLCADLDAVRAGKMPADRSIRMVGPAAAQQNRNFTASSPSLQGYVPSLANPIDAAKGPAAVPAAPAKAAAKPAETADTKPAEAKPAEAKPAEARPEAPAADTPRRPSQYGM